MKVGILCAGDSELAPFLPLVGEDKITEKALLKFYEGKLEGVDVVAFYSGVGKVNAAIGAQLLVDHFHVDAVINAGVAGGMNPGLEIFDTVIAAEVVHHDMAEEILTEFHPWLETAVFDADPELLRLSKLAVDKLPLENRVIFGRMATGEAFIADEGRDAILEKFDPLTVDMETAAVAQVCHAFGVPFIAIRSITDTAEHSGAEHFEQNCAKASVIARDITLALLREMAQ